jgi:inhibitor of apoptosis domain-containing protein
MCFDARAPHFQRFSERLRTFNKWSRDQTPESLAGAGFFRTKEGVDDVQCFYCGIRVFDWEPHDDPLSEHLRWSSNCAFAQLMLLIKTSEELLGRSLLFFGKVFGDVRYNNSNGATNKNQNEEIINCFMKMLFGGRDVVGNNSEGAANKKPCCSCNK